MCGSSTKSILCAPFKVCELEVSPCLCLSSLNPIKLCVHVCESLLSLLALCVCVCVYDGLKSSVSLLSMLIYPPSRHFRLCAALPELSLLGYHYVLHLPLPSDQPFLHPSIKHALSHVTPPTNKQTNKHRERSEHITYVPCGVRTRGCANSHYQ